MSSIELASVANNGGNTPPTAQDDTVTANQNAVARGNVITNLSVDTDLDGDRLTVVGVGTSSGQVGTAVAGSEGGLFTIQANGALQFDPNDAFDGLAAGEKRRHHGQLHDLGRQGRHLDRYRHRYRDRQE